MGLFDRFRKPPSAPSPVAPEVRTDDWYSTLGGIGGSADRGRARVTRLRQSPRLTNDELSAAYRDLWLVRKIVEAPCAEALKRGWGLPEGTKTPNFDLLNYNGAHDEGAFERACHMAELKGGAGLFIGYRTSSPDPAELLTPAPANGEVAFLEVFDRFELTGNDRLMGQDNAGDLEFGKPQTWTVTGGARRSGLRFHTSRMIKFPGRPRASALGVSEEERDWGDSVLQALWTDVQRYGVFWQTVGHLLQISSVGVLELKGLIQLLASKNQADVEARIDLLNQMVGNTKMLMLDAGQGEKYHRESVSFSDVPQLLDRLEVATAAAVGRPVSVLFGRAPAGLNATGDADVRMWYSDVEAYRTRVIEPRLERLLAITERRTIDVEFEPLWSPTEKEQAEVRSIETNADHIAWTDGIWSSDELRQARQEGKRPEQMKFPAKAPEPPPTPEPTGPFGAAPTDEPEAKDEPPAKDE